jgi:hypothetical protein
MEQAMKLFKALNALALKLEFTWAYLHPRTEESFILELIATLQKALAKLKA